VSYQGPLSFNTIDGLLVQLKSAAQENHLEYRVYKKLLSVMVEALENVTKYNEENLFENGKKMDLYPSLNIHLYNNSVELITINPIKNHHIKQLKKRIEKVNNKSRDELKELYKVTISNGRFTSKGGAGLGLIEMAKTSGKNLKYSFQKISDNYSLYTFKVSFDI